MTRLRASLIDAEGEDTWLKEMISLQVSLVEAEEKASFVECWVSEVAVEAIEAFRKGEDFCQELLQSCQDAYAKGILWCRRKVAMYYPNIDLDVLPSRRSSFTSNLASGGFDAEEGGEVTSPTPKPLFFVFI